MARHADLKILADLPVHFRDPRSPGRRGTNENANGLPRQRFPKGADLSQRSSGDPEAVAAALNGRPRKTLGWKTPAEALDELLPKRKILMRRPIEFARYLSIKRTERLAEEGVDPSGRRWRQP